MEKYKPIEKHKGGKTPPLCFSATSNHIFAVPTENRPVIAGFTVPDFESASHNPEVAGSNPAPATRRKDLEPYGSKSFFAYFLFLQ